MSIGAELTPSCQEASTEHFSDGVYFPLPVSRHAEATKAAGYGVVHYRVTCRLIQVSESSERDRAGCRGRGRLQSVFCGAAIVFFVSLRKGLQHTKE